MTLPHGPGIADGERLWEITVRRGAALVTRFVVIAADEDEALARCRHLSRRARYPQEFTLSARLVGTTCGTGTDGDLTIDIPRAAFYSIGRRTWRDQLAAFVARYL